MDYKSAHNLLEIAENNKRLAEGKLEELKQQIPIKMEEINQLDVVIEFIQANMNSDKEKTQEGQGIQEQEDTPPVKTASDISFIDATIQILEDAGRMLHISKIISELEVRYGKTTTARNLSGNIGKDALKRFKNFGGNQWDLVRFHPPKSLHNTEENENGVAASTTTPLFSSNEGGNS